VRQRKKMRKEELQPMLIEDMIENINNKVAF
jgi:hypothetical protein